MSEVEIKRRSRSQRKDHWFTATRVKSCRTCCEQIMLLCPVGPRCMISSTLGVRGPRTCTRVADNATPHIQKHISFKLTRVKGLGPELAKPLFSPRSSRCVITLHDALKQCWTSHSGTTSEVGCEAGDMLLSRSCAWVRSVPVIWSESVDFFYECTIACFWANLILWHTILDCFAQRMFWVVAEETERLSTFRASVSILGVCVSCRQGM